VEQRLDETDGGGEGTRITLDHTWKKKRPRVKGEPANTADCAQLMGLIARRGISSGIS